MKRLLLIAALFAALAITATAQADAPLAQQGPLTAADARDGDLLGGVNVSGGTLVAVSSAHDNGPNATPGAVYVFERAAAGWAHAQQTAELTLPDGSGAPTAAVISGDTIAVAAEEAKVGNNDGQGAIFVFEKPASGWKDAKPSAELTASDGATDDDLGLRLAISGDTIVASAPFHTVRNNKNQGTVYVFVKLSGGWANGHETAELTAGDGAANDLLGDGLAIDGDTLVAGARAHKVGNNLSQGQAYVFVKPSTGWASRAQDARLASSHSIAGEGFGSPIAISGDTIAIGIPSRTGPNSLQGAVDVFVKPAQGWVTAIQTAELTASDGRINDHLGSSVSVSGERILAGAAFRTTATNEAQGAAYVFDRQGSDWKDATETEQLMPSDGAASSRFGTDAVLAGRVAFISAPGRSLGDRKTAGAAYVFGRAPSITIAAPADGATFTQGDAAAASYSCAAATGATVATCAGPVGDGAPIDTASPGSHTFAVNAVDSDGMAAAKSVSYTVRAKATPPPPAAPSITALKQSAPVWREGGKRPTGTTFSFRLDQPARVALRFARRVHGRTKAAGTVVLNGHAGSNKVRFKGRVSRTRRLAPGRYTLQITATNSAGRSAGSRRLSFSIVR